MSRSSFTKYCAWRPAQRARTRQFHVASRMSAKTLADFDGEARLRASAALGVPEGRRLRLLDRIDQEVVPPEPPRRCRLDCNAPAA
jgi:hypothetical protein